MRMKLILASLVTALSLGSMTFGQNDIAVENIAKEVRFLEQNKQREGVKVTKSGLQYEVVQDGSGKSPAATDKVTVHYEGKSLNGNIFDSSYRRNQPATFPLNQVIPGWTEGVQLMKTGATYLFYIPSKLAYGAQGAPGAIGPNECLIFKVELISIQ